jgi:hypothetical protein
MKNIAFINQDEIFKKLGKNLTKPGWKTNLTFVIIHICSFID